MRPWSDRVFGLIALFGGVGFVLWAQTLRSSFMVDPVGPKAFPMMIGAVAAICGAVMLWRPDPDPEWPQGIRLGLIGVALVTLIAYAYALKPLGFLIPTALAAGILAWLIGRRAGRALVAGVVMSVGLFVLFKYGLGLSLQPIPRDWLG